MSPSRPISVCAAACVAFASLSPIAAQEADSVGGLKRPSQQTLQNLASVLGEAHAVRSLCNGEDDQTWRAYMMELLDLEAPGGANRSTLVRAFNNGYKSQRNNNGECSDRLVAVESEVAARGRALAETAARVYLE